MKRIVPIFLLVLITGLLSAQNNNDKTQTSKSTSGTFEFSIGTEPAADTASSGVVNFKIGLPPEDKTPPEIVITSIDPARGFKPVVKEKEFFIEGKVTDAGGILEVLVNGQDAYLNADGNFSINILLAIGLNTITVEATDIKRNTAVKEFTIERVSDQQITEKKEPVVTEKATLIPESNYYALIIGNEVYLDPEVPTLSNPIKDATKLYEVLTDSYVFKPENITFLKNATYVQMINAFDELSNKITPNDNLLIFYAGHGHWDEAKKLGYWLPVDAQNNSTAFWIPNSRISDYLKATNSQHTLLIADACFSGSIFKTRVAFNDAQPAINRLYELPSRKAMTSGNMKTVPDESVFVTFLIKRLVENTEKYISSDMLFSSFRQAVLNNSQTEPQYGIIQNTGDEGGEFIFIHR